jgi:MFS family permease
MTTPLPILKIALVGLVLFVNNFSMFVIFPMLPFIVQSFFPDMDNRDLGYYAGYLASAFHLGALISSLVWGIIADRIGRRPVLIFGTAGTGIAIVLFAFSKSFAMAIFARFLWGALNGNVGVAKTYLSEVCDDSNQAKGFAVIGFAASSGRLFGPIVGGYLSQPAKHFKAFEDSEFFKTFEFFLPMLIGMILCVVIFFLSLVFLEETLKFDQGTDKRHRPCFPDVRALFSDQMIRTTVLLFSFISFTATMSEEIFSLWLVLPPDIGGFGFGSSQIGTVISACAPIQLVCNAFVYPKITEKHGFKRVFIVSIFISALLIAALPFSNLFPKHLPDYKNTTFFVLVLLYASFITFRFFGFTSVFALINNSCHASDRATVNGIGQSLASISRFISPALGGSIFAWSISVNALNFINVHLVFWIMCICFIITSNLARNLPDSINFKLAESPDQSSVDLMLDHDQERSNSSVSVELPNVTRTTSSIQRRRSTSVSE